MTRARTTIVRAAGVLLLFGALALIGLAAPGCGLFEIRNPQDPSQNSCARHQPNSYDSTVFNFEAGMACKIRGKTNLTEALGSNFRFILDPLDVIGSRRPDSLEASQTLIGFDSFFQSLLTEDRVFAEIRYRDLPADRNRTLPDGRQFFDDVVYEIRVTDGKPNPTIRRVLNGVADIYFVDDGGNWTFDRWEDQAQSTGGAVTLGSVLGDAIPR